MGGLIRGLRRTRLYIALIVGVVAIVSCWVWSCSQNKDPSAFGKAQEEGGFVLISTDQYSYFVHDRRRGAPRFWFEQGNIFPGGSSSFDCPFVEWPEDGCLCYTDFRSIRVRRLHADSEEVIVPNCVTESLARQPVEGGALYFEGSYDDVYGLFRVDQEDKTVSMLMELEFSASHFDVSSNGSVVLGRFTQEEVVLIIPGEQTEIYTLGSGAFPRFSPQGDRVAYRSWEESGMSIVMTEVDPPFVSRRFAAGCGAAWSPDGTMLFSLSSDMLSGRVLSMAGEILVESPAPPLEFFTVQRAIWSPDSRFVAFCRRDREAVLHDEPEIPVSVMAMDIKTGEVSELWDFSRNENVVTGTLWLGFLHTHQ